MQIKKLFLTAILLAIHSLIRAQTGPTSSLSGQVTATDNEVITGATVRLSGGQSATQTDASGRFTFNKLQAGKYVLTITSTGFRTYQQEILLSAGETKQLAVMMTKSAVDLASVNVVGQTVVQAARQQAFAVTVIDAKKIAERDIDLNRLMDGQAGIRVQETGGMGSEFNYSINGLSGKAVKFYVDGVPMESFGSSFSINNFPANIIDRIEVYKGVTPVDLGGDALGGAINIITRKDRKNYLDLSQSYGSFNTSRTAVSGRWRNKSGFTLQTNSFFNYSDNNYQVWGPTVEIAGSDGRPLPGYPRFRRFNDDYRAYTLKADAGFTGVSWADELLIGVTYANQNRGIQTGRTMAYVFGDVRYREDFVMPSLRYAKRGLFNSRLNLELYASTSRLNGTTIDTGSRKYNWAGNVIGGVANGEMDGYKASKSMYTFTDNTTLARINVSYNLTAHQLLTFNYNLNSTSRKGADAIGTAEWTVPFRFPQDMHKQIAGLSYEAVLFERFTTTLFVKHFAYQANATVFDYNGGSTREVFYRNTKDNAWGVGYAGKYLFDNNYLIKFSAENTSRLPEAAELLGNGNTILNASTLKPERSTNINASVHKSWAINNNKLQASLSTFFRDTRNLVWLGEANITGSARYENLGRIRALGAEVELTYTHNKLFEASANFTYQDIRNRLEFESNGARSLVYNDRLRNTPYLMANGEVRVYLDQALHLKEKLTFYVNSHFVNRYYLGWPSLGAPAEKMFIPTQFVQDAGLSYAFSQGRYSINLACRNLFDRQVYDNYLLQKPGRFLSLKLRYFIQ